MSIFFRLTLRLRMPFFSFTQLIILEATGDPTLVDYIKYKRRFNFFAGSYKRRMTRTSTHV